MLAIGRALMAEPRLLLVDELSLGLMPKMVDLCLDVLMRLKREGLTILLVEQNTARALDVADQVCVLSSGAQVFQGTAAEAKAAGSLFATFLGRTSESQCRAGATEKQSMAAQLTVDDIEPALIGGLFLSAGGSGKAAAARGRALGRMALALGGGDVRSRSTSSIQRAPIITATAIGAPGFAESPVHAARFHRCGAAARRACWMQPPVGVICGHVPGFNAWLVAAALGLPYVDAASNGRGHPTVKMGGMGLASRPDLSIIQVACSAGKDNSTARRRRRGRYRAHLERHAAGGGGQWRPDLCCARAVDRRLRRRERRRRRHHLPARTRPRHAARQRPRSRACDRRVPRRHSCWCKAK